MKNKGVSFAIVERNDENQKEVLFSLTAVPDRLKSEKAAKNLKNLLPYIKGLETYNQNENL